MNDNNFPLNELSISGIFNSNENITYEIPIYQRNYAWEKDEITALVRDVWDAYEKKKDAYHIGTLVSFDKGDKTVEVIDGQQRLTTLFILLKAMKQEVRNKLTYRARTRSIRTLDIIGKDEAPTSNDLEAGIVAGYNYAKQAIDEIVDNSNKDGFIKYLLDNVRIVHYNVPKDVDLNHYFEVMNSRGEQLEKHEIVKAKLMNELDSERDKSKFAAIWDACSEMNIYIQTKFGVRSYFADNLKDFKYYDKSFDDLPEINESESKLSTLRELINSSETFIIKKASDGDDSKNSIFQPIIDFPNFLLIVLKITRMGEGDFNPNTFVLDDKELISEFDKALSAFSGNTFAKCFCFNLLLIRYLLDNYVVHHTNAEETAEENPWKLQRWQVDGKSKYAKNLAESKQQDKLVQLLSMFEVSFTARQRKNYLFYVLYHLSENRDIDEYDEFLENLAKKYFYDIYMNQKCLNEINTPKPGAFDQAIIKEENIDENERISNTTYDSFNAIYGDGSIKTKGIPLFVFNYMDYCLWYKYATTLAGEELKKDDERRRTFFDNLGCSDFGLDVFKQFYFSRTRRSLEHYYPQANINAGITEDQINCFGNFAMIGSEANSSGSNWNPHTKLDHYLDSSNKIRQVSVASLKFRIMMQVCFDNYGIRQKDEEWMFDDIRTHQNLMLKILFE